MAHVERPIIARPLIQEALPATPASSTAPAPVNEAAHSLSTHNAAQFRDKTSYANAPRGVFAPRAAHLVTSHKLSPTAAQICDRAYEYLDPQSTPPETLARACEQAFNGRNS